MNGRAAVLDWFGDSHVGVRVRAVAGAIAFTGAIGPVSAWHHQSRQYQEGHSGAAVGL